MSIERVWTRAKGELLPSICLNIRTDTNELHVALASMKDTYASPSCQRGQRGAGRQKDPWRIYEERSEERRDETDGDEERERRRMRGSRCALGVAKLARPISSSATWHCPVPPADPRPSPAQSGAVSATSIANVPCARPLRGRRV